MPLCRCLHILVLTAVPIVVAAQPAYPQEIETKIEEGERLLHQMDEAIRSLPQGNEAVKLESLRQQVAEGAESLHQIQEATRLQRQLEKLAKESRYADAIPIAEKWHRINEKLLGPDHPAVVKSLSYLPDLHYLVGNYAKAVSLYERALGIQRKVLGPEDPRVVTSLNNLAGAYLYLGDYEKAERLWKRCLAIQEKTLGPEHPSVATSFNNLAALYYRIGDYDEAGRLCKKALEVSEKALVPDHPDMALRLHNLGELYRFLGDYDKAEALFKRALAIREKVLGREHAEVANSLNGLALLYCALGDYAKAQPLFKRSLEIREKSFGPEHPSLNASLAGLGFLYKTLGDYDKAETVYKRSLAISQKAFGSKHPHVAASLVNLAQLYYSLGDYGKAEPLLTRALAINEKAFRSEPTHLAAGLCSLALLYNTLGQYGKAEPLYRRALGVLEKALGPEHPDVANTLNLLAMLYCAIGDYGKAEPLYRRALGILEVALGPEHLDVANTLNNLASLYYLVGDSTKVEPLFKRSLAIHEKVLGREHPDVAYNLDNLAQHYTSLGGYAKAEPLFERALALREKVLGPEHPDVANSLNNLASLYYSLGDTRKAEQLCKRSLTIKEKSLGREHPDVAVILYNLAVIYHALENLEKAHELLKREQEIDSKLIDQIMGFTSEDQKIKFLSMKSTCLCGFLSHISQYLAWEPSAKEDALNVWLRRKGVILEVQRRFQDALFYSDDPTAVKTFQDLARVRAQLSKLTFSGPGKADLEVYKKKIADWEEQKMRLEAKLSQLSQAFALNKKIAKADCEKVAGALPSNTALIDFARIGMFNFRAKGKEPKWKPAHYLAFVIHAGKGNYVGMIDLGSAERIDNAVFGLKKDIVNTEDLKVANAVDSARAVYQLVFAPLIKELGDVKEIFISPDGILNLIPFEVLMGPDGRYLIEDFTFNYLGSGRDVVGFGQFVGEGKGALLMGDPDFDLDHEQKKLSLRKLALMDGNQERITRRSADMKGFHFTRLPGAREEVKVIQKILGECIKSEIYLGSEALEEVLKHKSSPRILHLATHGFFLNDQDFANILVDPAARGIYSMAMPVKKKGRKVRIENPMLRSGFVLAGANSSLQTMDEQADDGIVTSEEILGLRLRGTDMVVLSACDTGLGEVKTGEGVFGLRRAFAQAGATSLIMSLWSVPDKETRELMVEFYKNITTGEMNRCQALRQAALKEMKIVKKRYGHAHPFFWGGFVMVGDPGQPSVNMNIE